MTALTQLEPSAATTVLAMNRTGHRAVVGWLRRRLDRERGPMTLFQDLDWSAFTGQQDPEDAGGRTLVVVRDLPNFIASRLSAGLPVGPAVVRAWCSHVQAALDALPDDPVVFVDYPAWHASSAYRDRLAARLGLAGRSDPGPTPDEEARLGSPWERWRDHALDPAWRAICLHPDLRALSGARFGDPLRGL